MVPADASAPRMKDTGPEAVPPEESNSLEARIRQTSTRFEFGRRVVGFGEHEVQTESGSLGPFDTIVLAVGYRPDTELSRALRSAGVAHTVIGDAIAPRKISDAVLEGFTAGYAV